jgi:heme exporter protein B
MMRALFRRDLALAVRAGGGALTGLLFFLAVVMVVPFAIGPDGALLARLGPAILWIGAALASLLTLDRLFPADREDGSLDLIVMGQDALSLSLLVAAKCAAHWIASLLPLALAAPVFALLLNMEPAAGLRVALTLLAGTPAFSFVGAAGAAVAVALPRGGVLVSVLALPLAVPVVIFGVGAASGPAFAQPFLLLCAATLFLAVVGPVGAALALRNAE